MSSSRRLLPDFRRPPVIEVLLSVQFDPIEALQGPHLGLLWQKFRARYPRIEQHAPISPRLERFGEALASTPTARIEMVDKPPLPRSWFLNEVGTELIQIQEDRFVHNWRKRGEDDEYPRFEHIRDQFSEQLDVFCSFIAQEELGKFVPNQCEVTYVNHIVAGDGWEKHGELGKVFTVWKEGYSDDFLSEPETAEISVRYVIYNETNEPIGRLYVISKPGFSTTDKKPILRLELSARGKPEDDSVASVLSFMELGREHIVRAFASITTKKMHKVWGRYDAQ